MLKRILAALLSLAMVVGFMGSAKAAEAPQPFQVQLTPDMTATDVTSAILEAGAEQVAAACSAAPESAIRVFNPLASGGYQDVPCSAVLTGETIGSTSEPLTSGGEHIGQTKEPLVLGAIVCGLGGLLASYVRNKACEDWRGPNSQFCKVGGVYSDTAWVVACAII